MNREVTYCQAPGCDEPTKEGRKFCPRDTKRYQRQRAGKSAPPLGSPPAERLPPMERAIEAFSLMAETPAEDDALYEKRRRDLEAILLEMSRRARPEAIRRGMERARAQGKRIGRPRKLVIDDRAKLLMEKVGKTTAAQLLGVAPRTLFAALARMRDEAVSAGGAEGVGRKKRNLSAVAGSA